MRAFSLAALFAFLIDQASKIWVMYGLSMTVGDRWEIFPPFLVFHFGWNPGINFGLFSDSPQVMRYVLIGLAVVISIWLTIWARNSLKRPISHISAGLIVGGALANALDRLFFGAVVDFLNMSCCGINNPFIFNLADVAIFAGAFGLILFDDDKHAQKTT